MEITTKVVSKLCKSQPLALGIQLESNRRAIIFDCSDFDEQISSIMIVHQRHDDVAPYIAAYSANERTCTWIITATDTSFFGYGKLEVRIAFINDLGNGLGKTITIPTMVIKSITADAVIPSALQSWYDEMIDYIDENAVTLDEVDAAIQAYLDEHPISAPVTSVNGQTGDVVISIPTKVSDLVDDSGHYTKPSGGIPKTDLASGVQSSLGKADTAYQKPSGGIPDTDLASAVQTSLGKADTAYQKPSAGIPATDLASGVIPSVPTKTSQLQNDSSFVADASYVHTDENYTSTEKSKLSGIAAGAEVNVQANWNESDSSSDAYIQNKPTIPVVPAVDSSVTAGGTNPVNSVAVISYINSLDADNTEY